MQYLGIMGRVPCGSTVYEVKREISDRSLRRVTKALWILAGWPNGTGKMSKPHSTVMTMLCAMTACGATGEPTWVKIGETTYGASADERGPIGGGPGYSRVVTKGDFVVKDLDGLLDALAKARAGQTVFIPGETEIDLTARFYIEQLVLEVPPSKSTTTHFARHSRPW